MANAKRYCASSDMHVLILGESGVGKTTLIKAIANYIQYDDFKSALKSELVYPVTKYSGNDNNQSQGLTCHKIPLKTEHVLRIYEATELFNWNHLMEIPSLNAICIILNHEVSPDFKQQMNNMLSTFDLQSCNNNIIFILTKTSEPTAVATDLKKYVDNFRRENNVEILFKKNVNFFYINNLSFCLLSQSQNKDMDIDKYVMEANWREASNAGRSILTYVSSLNLISTGCSVALHVATGMLDNGHRLLTALDYLQDNLDLLYNLQNIHSEQQLLIPVLEFETSNSPSTICTGDNCKEILQVCWFKKYAYKVCHSSCNCTNICKKISVDGCVDCKCSQSLHIRIPQKINWVVKHEQLQPLYKRHECAAEDYPQLNFMSNVENRKFELFQEMSRIFDILGLLTEFVRSRKPTYENGLKRFLHRQITWEGKQHQRADYLLKRYKDFYNPPIGGLNSRDYDPEDVLNFLAALRSLKHSGKLLQFEELPKDYTPVKLMEIDQNVKLQELTKAADKTPKESANNTQKFFENRNAKKSEEIHKKHNTIDNAKESSNNNDYDVKTSSGGWCGTAKFDLLVSREHIFKAADVDDCAQNLDTSQLIESCNIQSEKTAAFIETKYSKCEEFSILKHSQKITSHIASSDNLDVSGGEIYRNSENKDVDSIIAVTKEQRELTNELTKNIKSFTINSFGASSFKPVDKKTTAITSEQNNNANIGNEHDNNGSDEKACEKLDKYNTVQTYAKFGASVEKGTAQMLNEKNYVTKSGIGNDGNCTELYKTKECSNFGTISEKRTEEILPENNNESKREHNDDKSHTDTLDKYNKVKDCSNVEKHTEEKLLENKNDTKRGDLIQTDKKVEMPKDNSKQKLDENSVVNKTSQMTKGTKSDISMSNNTNKNMQNIQERRNKDMRNLKKALEKETIFTIYKFIETMNIDDDLKKKLSALCIMDIHDNVMGYKEDMYNENSVDKSSQNEPERPNKKQHEADQNNPTSQKMNQINKDNETDGIERIGDRCSQNAPEWLKKKQQEADKEYPASDTPQNLNRDKERTAADNSSINMKNYQSSMVYENHSSNIDVTNNSNKCHFPKFGNPSCNEKTSMETTFTTRSSVNIDETNRNTRDVRVKNESITKSESPTTNKMTQRNISSAFVDSHENMNQAQALTSTHVDSKETVNEPDGTYKRKADISYEDNTGEKRERTYANMVKLSLSPASFMDVDDLD